jgi:hypothetical protein
LCEVPDEPALRRACALLAHEDVRFAAFHEPDRAGELTALATEPLRGRARRPLRRFPLLTDPAAQPPPPSTSTACADPARADYPNPCSGGSVMSTDSMMNVFRTSFGQYVPCDRATYRKLKRIRHLATFAEAERKRWDRSQRRLPHNRTFKRHRLRDAAGRFVREPVDARRMIFPSFYELVAADPSLGLPPDARLTRQTELFARFFADYRAVKHPKPTAGEVGPLKLSIAELDELLTRIEVWNLRR